MTVTEQLADVIALVVHTEMAQVLAKLAALEARPAVSADTVDALKETCAELRDRLGVMEGRAAVPGPAGKDADPLAVQALIDLSVSKAIAGLPAPKDGAPGASVDPVVVETMVTSQVQRAMAALPVPKDGQSVTVADVLPAITAEVSKAVAALPPAKDGAPGASVDVAVVESLVASHVKRAVADLPPPKDGRSVTLDDATPVIVAEIQKQIGALPSARDGVGFTGALIDRAGHLVLTLSDGGTKDVGPVVGRDGQGVVASDVMPTLLAELHKAIGRIPIPKDGEPGLGFDDLDLVFDEGRGYLLRCQRGSRIKEWAIPLPFDAGVWQPGRVYPKGAGVTVKGAWWIAQTETSARPGDDTAESRAWRLSVKGGRDGKDGKNGKDGSGA